MIVIAESLKHNVEAVYLFQTKLVEYVEEVLDKNKIIFFNDGADIVVNTLLHSSINLSLLNELDV